MTILWLAESFKTMNLPDPTMILLDGRLTIKEIDPKFWQHKLKTWMKIVSKF